MKIEDDVWEAERLLRRRRRNGHCEYLVKWRSYPLRDSTWEPEENILDTGLLAHFNYSLKMRGIAPSGRGRPRKRPPAARSALPVPAKRQRRAADLGPLPSSASASSSSSSGVARGARGRPRSRPPPSPVRERNQKPRQELEGSEDSEDTEDDVEDDVEDEEERENVGRRRRSSRLARTMPPLRRRPLMVTPGQGALTGVKRRDLLLTDVTWDGVTVTIKEDLGSKSGSIMQ